MRKLLIAVLAVVAMSADAATVRRIGASVFGPTTTAQVLLSKFPTRTITYCVLVGGVAQQDITFRPVGGGIDYATITIGAGATVTRTMNTAIPAGGVEVVSSSSAGDVTIECLYKLTP